MNRIEKLKRKFLLWAMDDYVDLINILDQFQWEENLTQPQINQTTLQFINIFLENNLYELGNVDEAGKNFIPWNFSKDKEQTLLKEALNKEYGSDIFWQIQFNLTEKGQKAANEYFSKLENLKAKILENCTRNFCSLNEINILVAQDFNTTDFDEIKYECLEHLISYLVDHELWNIHVICSIY